VLWASPPLVRQVFPIPSPHSYPGLHALQQLLVQVPWLQLQNRTFHLNPGEGDGLGGGSGVVLATAWETFETEDGFWEGCTLFGRQIILSCMTWNTEIIFPNYITQRAFIMSLVRRKAAVTSNKRPFPLPGEYNVQFQHEIFILSPQVRKMKCLSLFATSNSWHKMEQFCQHTEQCMTNIWRTFHVF